MKKYFRIMLLFMAIMLSPQKASATSAIDFTNIPIPGLSFPLQSLTELKICQLRRLFCGQKGAVFIAVAAFLIGASIIYNKIDWGTAILIIAGMVIFWNADYIARIFLNANFLIAVQNPLCSCTCAFDKFLAPTCNELKACYNAMNIPLPIQWNCS